MPPARGLTQALAFLSSILRALALCAALLPVGAHACTCRDRHLSEDEKIRLAFRDARQVLLARVVSYTLSEGSEGTIGFVAATFEPVETFKGGVSGLLSGRHDYTAGAYSSSCSEGIPPLTPGQSVLLYMESPEVTEWTFSYCSMSRVVHEPDTDREVLLLRAGHQGAES